MALQTPAFALQNASGHTAALFRQAASSSLLTPGVLSSSDLVVAAQSTPNMSVQISAGQAWVGGTQVANVTGGNFNTQASYFALNDGPVTETIATSDPTNPRIDLVYLALQDSFYSGSSDQPVFGVVTGTPAASPAVPAAPANALALAHVAVAANATSITSGNITSPAAQAQWRSSGLYVCTSTTRPSNPYTGQQVYETDTGRIRMWNGSTWSTVSVLGDTGWTNLTPGTSGWTSGTQMKYRVLNGVLHFFILANASGGITANAAVCTFPSQYLPAVGVDYFDAAFYNNLFTVLALNNTTGAMTVQTGQSGSTGLVANGSWVVG